MQNGNYEREALQLQDKMLVVRPQDNLKHKDFHNFQCGGGVWGRVVLPQTPKIIENLRIFMLFEGDPGIIENMLIPMNLHGLFGGRGRKRPQNH